MHPVYLTIGNLDKDVCNFRKKVFNECWTELCKPIVEKGDGLVLKVGKVTKTCIPRIPYFVVDEKELGYITGHNSSWRADMPCSNCMHKPR